MQLFYIGLTQFDASIPQKAPLGSTNIHILNYEIKGYNRLGGSITSFNRLDDFITPSIDFNYSIKPNLQNENLCLALMKDFGYKVGEYINRLTFQLGTRVLR